MILKHYDHKVDIWAAGVIFYVLLTGKPPFHAVMTNPQGKVVLDYSQIKKLILKGKVDFSHGIFQKVGPMIVNIIQAMLSLDPENRPEAIQLLSHPFFKISEHLDLNREGKSISIFKKSS